MVAQQINILDEIASFLASMDAEKVLKFHASPAAQKRMEALQWKNKESKLTGEERQEMEQYLVVEHIVRLAKIRARQRMANAA